MFYHACFYIYSSTGKVLSAHSTCHACVCRRYLPYSRSPPRSPRSFQTAPRIGTWPCPIFSPPTHVLRGLLQTHSFIRSSFPSLLPSFIQTFLRSLFVLSPLVGWLIELVRLLVSSSVHSFAHSFVPNFCLFCLLFFLSYRSYAEIDYLMVGTRSIYFIPFQINSTAFPLKRGKVNT